MMGFKQARFLALGLGLGLSLSAQAPDLGLSSDFKIRVGAALGSSDDKLTNRVMGLGFALGYGAPYGRWSAELGYQYKPGDQYLSNINDMPYAAGSPKPDPAYSVDSRKNTLEGITLRLAFERPFFGNFGWQAGIQLGGSRFRHEFLGDVGNTSWTKYEDTYNGTPTKSTLALSPFAGISYRFNPASSVEVNLIRIGYKAINYVHVAGADLVKQNSTSLDYIEQQSRGALHLEVGYVFHF